MKSDAELKQDVEAELAWDPAIKAAAIGVAVKDGVVTVSGHLENYAEKWAVEDALRRIGGVKAIALELDVALSPDHHRSDTDIANAAQAALKWHALIPPSAVRVTVSNGWITLDGEMDWEYQRKSAENALRNLKGVMGITNLIKLKPRPLISDLQQRVQSALTRQAIREAKKLDIQFKDGTVTLKGAVHSWHERDAVAGALWSVPGVRLVINELTIG